MASSIPEGFHPWTPTTPYMDHVTRIGTIYRAEGRGLLGLRLRPEHTNMHNAAHGGFLATFVDCAFGTVITEACQSPVVTVSMSVDFLQAGRIGDWLEACVTIDKPGKRLIYASCAIKAAGQTLVKASGIFARQS